MANFLKQNSLQNLQTTSKSEFQIDKNISNDKEKNKSNNNKNQYANYIPQKQLKQESIDETEIEPDEPITEMKFKKNSFLNSKMIMIIKYV